MRVTKTAIAALRNHRFLPVNRQIRQHDAVLAHNRTNWYLDNQILSTSASATLTRAIFTVLSFQLGIESKINQGIRVFVGAKDNTTATTTVATVRTAFRDINFVAKRYCAVAALAGLEFDFCRIDEHFNISREYS